MLISVDLEGTTPSKLSRKAVCERSLCQYCSNLLSQTQSRRARVIRTCGKPVHNLESRPKALYSIFNKELIVFLSAVQTALCHAGGCQLCIE